MNKPTVGRIVHFYSAGGRRKDGDAEPAPAAAIITKVHEDPRLVDLFVFGDDRYGITGAHAVAGGDEAPFKPGAPVPVWVWPPREDAAA